MPSHKIRASMLPGYSDCMRRTIGRIVRPAPPPKRAAGVATVFGSVVHATLAAYIGSTGVDIVKEVELQLRVEKNTLPGGKIAYDPITKDDANLCHQAVQIIKRMQAEGLDDMLGNGVEFCEQEFTVPIERLVPGVAGDIVVGGTLDILTSKGTLIDWKTGMALAAYPVQMALYGMLAELHGATVCKLLHYWIRRKDAQLKTIWYDYEESKGMAIAILTAIARQVVAPVDNPLLQIIPNPSSRLCSEKYCDLHGTPDCSFGVAATHHPKEL